MSSENLCTECLEIPVSWIKSNFRKILILVDDKVLVGTRGYSRTACVFSDDPSWHLIANRLAFKSPIFEFFNILLNQYSMHLIGYKVDKKDGNGHSLHFNYC